MYSPDDLISWAQGKYGDQFNYDEIKLEGANNGLSPSEITQVIEVLEAISGVPVTATMDRVWDNGRYMPKVTLKVMQNGEPVTKGFIYDQAAGEFRSIDNPTERYDMKGMNEIIVRESIVQASPVIPALEEAFRDIDIIDNEDKMYKANGHRVEFIDGWTIESNGRGDGGEDGWKIDDEHNYEYGRHINDRHMTIPAGATAKLFRIRRSRRAGFIMEESGSGTYILDVINEDGARIKLRDLDAEQTVEGSIVQASPVIPALEEAFPDIPEPKPEPEGDKYDSLIRGNFNDVEYYRGPREGDGDSLRDISNYDVAKHRLSDYDGVDDADGSTIMTEYRGYIWVKADNEDAANILLEIMNDIESNGLLDEGDYEERSSARSENYWQEYAGREMRKMLEHAAETIELPDSITSPMITDGSIEDMMRSIYDEYNRDDASPRTPDSIADWGDQGYGGHEGGTYDELFGWIVERFNGGTAPDAMPAEIRQIIEQYPDLAVEILKAYYDRNMDYDRIVEMVQEMRSSADPNQLRLLQKEMNRMIDKEMLKKKADINEPLDEDWENKLYGNPALQKIEVKDAGTWIESGDSEMGWKVQQIAKKYGWPGDIVGEDDPDNSLFLDAIEDAEQYLQSVAPENYHIGNNNDGAWGMFEMDVQPEELPTPEMMPDRKPYEDQTPDLLEKDIVEMSERPSEFEEWENRLAELAEKKDSGTLTPKEQEEMDELNDALMTSPAMSMGEEPVPVTTSKKYGPAATSVMKMMAQQEPPYEAPSGKVWKEVNGKLILMDQEAARTASIKQQASDLLNHVTIMSEFVDELHPRVTAQIREGDTVYLDKIGVFGTVIRILDEGAYRVEANDKIATYFELEVSKRD